MEPTFTLIAGTALLTVIGIISGGTFLLRVTTGGSPFNDLQKTFFRAGHAHAGVLVTLGLVCLLLQVAAAVPAAWQWGAVAVLLSAVLISAGFFLSVLGTDPQRPGSLIALLWAGVAALGTGLLLVAVSLIRAGL